MTEPRLNVVTGAFSSSGQYIARRLLAMGERVKTLTGHPDNPDPFGGQVQAAPYDFDRPAELVDTLRGATTLYNTYWVRLTYRSKTYAQAVENTRTLFRCAQEAGVRRVVHVSISNPSLDSPLPYFQGKAVLEQALQESGLSYAILRPTVLFGPGCILFNNIAWFLRRFPVFAIPGDGRYRIQPLYIDDLAEIAVAAGHLEENVVLDAVGPETYTYRELVRLIAQAVGSRAALFSMPPGSALLLARVLGWFVGDIVLTREEVAGLMDNLLVSAGPPTGKTSLRGWLLTHQHELGRAYFSEVARHYEEEHPS
jgi:NADH dehydrogenase